MIKGEKSNFADSWAGVRNSAHKNPQATRVPESNLLFGNKLFGRYTSFSEPYVAKYFSQTVFEKNNKRLFSWNGLEWLQNGPEWLGMAPYALYIPKYPKYHLDTPYRYTLYIP